ncbi:chromate efflux transporter [Roseimicrobium sp. ORNL1]|uniref:chromate efflux transporter n=1 Tax=Roseimicrobium sp. ORNL1 TaxID=2711231 RepID=UPI0013E1EDEB|nr:chromate efflux transporter [Roseimicrobium sp. ORNL1]QIF01151.1 chromate efflux transporter [Roseimicrobium sp. ORNL1]
MPEIAPGPAFPTFREALQFWIKLGFISFGGPAGQIAIMHKELVEKRRWISEPHFLHALNFCMLLPGPEAQQLATYLGWRLHGARGGIAAGGLFVLPSILILWALSWLYMSHGDVSWVKSIFYGLVPAVIAIIASAGLRIGKKALKTPALWLLAAASFVAIFYFKISFVLIILAAAAIGWIGSRISPTQFPATKSHGDEDDDSEKGFLKLPPCKQATWARTLKITLVACTLWWIPILLMGLWQGWASVIFRQGVFFSKAALMTFGGAYAVLPYVAQQAVEHHGWLTQPQMMSGLALAETTPGPLIMVLQFVGFVGAWQHPGEMSPLVAGTLGALITTWATFLPCFLFVFLGGPHVEHLRSRPTLSIMLTAITAAVVGVIVNLAVWFAWHALRPPTGGFDWYVLVVSIAAFIALTRFKAGVVQTIGVCALLGLVWKMLVMVP